MLGANFLLVTLLYIAVPLLVLAALYWVIRLAVRDGVLAAQTPSSGQQP